MRHSKFQALRPVVNTFPGPKFAYRDSSGFAYIALLVLIIIIGISLGTAGKYWSNVMLREKEEELLYRGDQYRRAIEGYYALRKDYPQNIDDLLRDPRSPTVKRHLRQKFKDPISGEDFVAVRNTVTRRIIGVNSPSDKEPLKKGGFPDIYSMQSVTPQIGFPVNYNNFLDKMKYSEWLFVSTAMPVQTQMTRTTNVVSGLTFTRK